MKKDPHAAEPTPGASSGSENFETGESNLDRMVEPEYASVSGTAIVALALTPLGLLALRTIYFHIFGLPVPILLILPLVSLGVALAAIRNIRRSEGTRVGIKLAAVAAIASGLIFLGAGSYHFNRIHQQQVMMNRLMQQARGDVQQIFTGNYRQIYDRMVEASPELVRRQPFDEWRKGLIDFLFGGGDYYGSRIEAVRMYDLPVDEQDPHSPTRLYGVVVRRLVFRNGSADLLFNYTYREGQWHLHTVYAQAATEFGRPEMKVIPRWEDELTGGQPTYIPPELRLPVTPEVPAPPAVPANPAAAGQP